MWNIFEVRFGARRCSTWNMNTSPLFVWVTGLGPVRGLGVANYSLIKLIRKCPTVTICLNIIVPRGTFGSGDHRINGNRNFNVQIATATPLSSQ